jgi:hypothetical protein
MGAPSVPTPAAVPAAPPAAAPATLANPQVAATAANARSRAAAAAGSGFAGTIGTSTQGAAQPTTAGATLLGGGS